MAENELKINKCCATCRHYAEYERKDGVVICGCYYYDMMCDKSTIDINKCNCIDGEGWDREDGRE